MATRFPTDKTELSPTEASDVQPTDIKRFANERCDVDLGDVDLGEIDLVDIDLVEIKRVGDRLRADAQRLAVGAVRLFRTRAALWWIFVCTLSAIGLIGLDYALHAEETGLRWLTSGAWWAVAVVAGWLFLTPAWFFVLTPIQVARWIEGSRPELAGRLSTPLAIAALPADDLRFGSGGFRNAALRQASQLVPEIDWSSFLDRRPTVRAAIALLTVMCVVVACAFVDPNASARGIQRLVVPWSVAPWPRADRLRIVNLPRTIASGSELQIQVVDDQPPLPESIELQLKVAALPAAFVKTNADTPGERLDVPATTAMDSTDAIERITQIPMQVLGEVALATLVDRRTSFLLRVVGGDDSDAPWQEVRVAEIPELNNIQFHVVPPAYTRQSATDLVGERIEVMAGSHVSMRGQTDRPLESLTAFAAASSARDSGVVQVNNSQLPAREALANSTSMGEETWPALLSVERQAFELFTQDSSGSVIQADRRLRLSIRTPEGLEFVYPQTWTIHAVADRPPVMQLLPIQPPWVTHEATIEFSGDATDDLELQEIRFLWQEGDSAEVHTRSIWPRSSDRGQSRGDVNLTTAGVQPSSGGTDNRNTGATDVDTIAVARSAHIRFEWHPSQDGVPAGATVSVFIEATDSAGQTTRSIPQLLQIQDSSTVLARMQAEEVKVFAPLRQILDTQRRNEQVVNRLSDIASKSQRWESDQVDAIRNARQAQHAIAQQLGQSQSSVKRKLQLLSDQLARNALERSAVAKHIQDAVARVEQLEEDFILPAVEDLDEVLRMLREVRDDQDTNGNQETRDEASAVPIETQPILEKLEAAVERQQQAVRAMQDLIDSFASAETSASLRKAFSELLARQNQLRGETEALQLQRALHPEQRDNAATQAGLQSDQQSLARAVEELSSTIAQQAAQGQDPEQITLERARQSLLQGRVSQQMRDAADLINSGNFSGSIRVQNEAARALESAAGNFGQHEKANAADELIDLGTAVAELVRRQTPVVEQLHQFEETKKALDDPSGAVPARLREIAVMQEAVRRNLSQVVRRGTLPDPFAWLLADCETDMMRVTAALERLRFDAEAVANAESALRRLVAAAEALQEEPNELSITEDQRPKDEKDLTQPDTSRNNEKRPATASLKLLRSLQSDINQRSQAAQESGNDASSATMIRLSNEQEALAEQTQKILQQLSN